MTNRKRQDNTITKRNRQTIQWPRGKDRKYWAFHCLSFPLGHCIVCLLLLFIVLSVFSTWSLYCLSFPLGHCIICLLLLVIVLSVFSSWSLYCLIFISWSLCCLSFPEEKTDNTMTKRKRQTIQWPSGKDRQYNDQEEKTDNSMTRRKRHTIQWPRGKDRQYNDQEEKTDNVLSVFSSWSLYCLSFPLGHCIVCLFLLVIVLSVFSSWSLHCLSFPLGHCIVCLFLLVIVQWPRGTDRQYNDQKENTDNTNTKRKRQTIQWPRGTDKPYNDQ
jgi:hypothetical protein